MKKNEAVRTDFILDPNYIALTPTHVLTASKAGVTVVTKLYGTVTPERVNMEQQAATYRADQLSK